jgi:hypothetical protein
VKRPGDGAGKRRGKVDIVADHHGTVVTLTPQTADGQQWMDDCEDVQGWEWFPPGLVCTPVWFARILAEAREDRINIAVNLYF